MCSNTSSEWALPLIRRHTYGAVVFEIDQHQLAEVPEGV
jgi:hypothetical protein